MSASRDLLAWLDARGILAADGAMGTALQEAGLPPGVCPESWNLSHAETVEGILRGYREAGAELIETNSFGGNPTRLSPCGLQDGCEEVNRIAAELARRAAGEEALVLGSIGPTGALLKPLGALSIEEAREGFGRQAAALVAGGADALCVETMIDLAEAIAAVRAASLTGRPVIASLTFEATARGFFTVMGAEAGRAARDLEAAGASVIGTNCGTGPQGMIEVLRVLGKATSLPLMVQPNAGIPILSGGDLRYPESPDGMAWHVARFAEAGARIVGGCCGTTAEHVRAISAEVRRVRGERSPNA